LVRQAGFDLKEAPNTRDDFWSFFKPVQKALRANGVRKMYALGLQITTVGSNDGNRLCYHFMIANGAQDFVTPDGELHTDDPKIREAAIHSVEFMTNLCKEG
jgi:multiple sugar transport system substrate-binding protein